MKKIIILLLFLNVFSCKKVQKGILEVNPNFTIEKKWSGDVLISDLNFAESINTSCKLSTPFFDRTENQIRADNLKCALSKIKYDYEILNSINTEIYIGNISSDVKLFIQNSLFKNKNIEDVKYQVMLYVEKDKIRSDSMIIYQSFNYLEALVVQEKYYYLNKNHIYTIDIVEDESGASVEKWEHYNINTNGKISLAKQEIFSSKVSNQVVDEKNIFWKGLYYFEASNRDEVKTIFNITINSLDNILVEVQDDGILNKYSNLKAEEINSEKIKITYNKSPDEMGVIYIEKSDNEYFISGNPIYFINPGNNEMPLKKIR